MKETVEHILDSVCKIDTPSGAGTGFAVAMHPDEKSQFILTNAHVVSGESSGKILVHGRTRKQRVILQAPFKVLFEDYSRDIAMIMVDNIQLKPLIPPDHCSAEIGGDYYSGGYPLACDFPRIVKGLFSGIDIMDFNSVTNDVMILDGTVHSGQSGSPILDTKGHLQAIVFAKYPCGKQSHATAGIGYAVFLSGIKQMLWLGNELSTKLDFESGPVIDVKLNIEDLASFQAWCTKNAGSPAPLLASNQDMELFLPNKCNGRRVHVPDKYEELIGGVLSAYLKIRPNGGRLYITGKKIFGFNPESNTYRQFSDIKIYGSRS
ncbi:MAG: trypsin-like peptidase domain-containing protein [Cycloclasticus sp.]|jgi:Trypsin-like serine proteases, typically periplasmic, contain C-terminal PDZ domain